MTQRKNAKATQEANLSASDEMPETDTASDAAHLDSFVASELEAEGGGEDDVTRLDEKGDPIQPEGVEQVVEKITKEAFFTVFRHAFGMPGMFSADWKPLAIQPEEEPIARDACNAIYEILEIYYPAALMPQGDTFARLAAAAPFVLAKVMVVREILNSKRRARIEAQAGAKMTFQTKRTPEPKAGQGEELSPDQMVPDPTAFLAQEAA